MDVNKLEMSCAFTKSKMKRGNVISSFGKQITNGRFGKSRPCVEDVHFAVRHAIRITLTYARNRWTKCF